MRTLKALWYRWEQVTAKVDNPIGRTVLTALLVVLWWQYPWAWKFLLPAYMLTLGKFVFSVASRTLLTVLYVLMVAPLGLFVRLGDPLRVRHRTRDTYWISRTAPDESLEGARRQG